MSKLNYPSDGLYPRCKEDLESCISGLSEAVLDCEFDIPMGFEQANYLNELGGKLAECLQEAKDIDAEILRIDQSFRSLSDDATFRADKILIQKVEKRERMVV